MLAKTPSPRGFVPRCVNVSPTSMVVVTPAMLEEALVVARKKHDEAPLDELRLERFREGPSAQVMHIGPYADEPATVERLHAFVTAEGYRLRGHHHEIYLGDPRRSAPEKLRTVLRHPIEPAA